jgi:hypothetical protein
MYARCEWLCRLDIGYSWNLRVLKLDDMLHICSTFTSTMRRRK